MNRCNYHRRRRNRRYPDLPGFDSNVKMRLLQQLKDKTDIILCIHAGDIERRKVRADFGITYDVDTLKLIDELRQDWGLKVAAVVITRFDEQVSAIHFKNKLERRGLKVHTHRITKGYPNDVDLIVSDQGYGANTYIKTQPLTPIPVLHGIRQKKSITSSCPHRAPCRYTSPSPVTIAVRRALT